jgi:hypothetical protein
MREMEANMFIASLESGGNKDSHFLVTMCNHFTIDI